MKSPPRAEPDLAIAPPWHRNRRVRGGLTAFAFVALIALLGTTVRLPAYRAGPGPARDVGKLITVTGKPTYPSQGAFLLTTVAVSDRAITLFEALGAWLDPAVAVVPRAAIVRPGLSDEQQDVVNRHDMEESKILAELVALRALGFRVPRMAGARVVTTVPGSPAAEVLQRGDVLVAVDGTRVLDVDAAAAAIQARGVGEVVTVAYVREGRRHASDIRTVESFLERGRSSIGATLGTAFRFPVRISIETHHIGGPSGGLVFALAIADALDVRDLTGGHRIAATGTIDERGHIGPIGGLGEKVLAAKRSGADIFIVPAAEIEEAREAAGSGIRVIGVRTLREALRRLRAVPPRRAAA